MKLIKYTSLGLFLLLAGLTISRGRAQASVHNTDEKAIDEYIIDRMSSGHFPGLALAIVKGDQIVYMKGYGHADESGRPVTPQTSFIIGSISKPFTDMAIMQLVDAGKVELDAPIQRYLPWFRVADPKASAQITVRMLINQTSGLPQAPTFVTWNWPDYPDALERHVRLLANMNLDSPPGKSFAYSNANSVILGMIVQVVSGQSYEDYIRQRLFAPLDMQHSFVSQEEAMRHGMAQGYRWWFGYPVPFNAPYNRANLPAGFIISGAEDMAHFLIAQMNGGRYQNRSVLSPDKIALMQSEPESGSFGMGWQFTRVNGRQVLHFEGGPANFQASLFFDPQARVGVFITANVINALDVLSSARSSGLLDGISTRIMAESVLSLATHQPLPNQGIGIRRLTLIFDLLILGLTCVQVASYARLPRFNSRLERRGITSQSDLAGLIGKTSAFHFAWPLVLLFVALKLPNWIILALFQPDLIIWLYSMAALTSLKGLLEIALIWRTFRRTHQPHNRPPDRVQTI
jgi:CubicO group peptidase (beta-lactamase class C family)